MNNNTLTPALEQNSLEGTAKMLPTHPDRWRALIFYVIRLLIILGFFLFALKAGAQISDENMKRKTVAVVLSGGGTKGMAHIGVLKALEENKIPIDYIAGTSIGAIIGSMYAAGFSPDEIEALVLSEEFEQAAVGKIDERYRHFYLEPEADPSWINLYFGWEDRLEAQNIIRQNIPSNIVSPYLMDFLFMEYLGPTIAAANYHFDNLYIPFRCIATEVESRRAVTMRDGSLPDAVRASMTFPFYFQPIEIDGKLMMDGGMFNNFPADVVHLEFMPDVVIGSVVSDNPAAPKRDNIVSQLENLLKHPTNYDILTDQGVLIAPNVPNIAVNDMSQNKEIIAEGYRAAMEHMEEINGFITVYQNPLTRHLRRMAFRNETPDLIIGEIKINGLRSNQEEFVLQALGQQSLPISFDEFKFNYLSLLLNNRFDYVYPHIEIDPRTGFFVISIEMEKTREILRAFGGNISSRPVNHIFGKFEYVRWKTNPLTLKSNLYLGNFYNSILGSVRLDVPGEHPLYLESSVAFSKWEYSRSSVFLIEEQNPPFLAQREFLASFRFGYPMDHDKKIEIGSAFNIATGSFFNTRSFAEADTMDHLRFNPYILFTTIERNTLDRKQFPTRGDRLYLLFRIMRGRERYEPGSTSAIPTQQETTRSWAEALISYKSFFRPRSRINPGFSAELFLSHRPHFSNYASTMTMARQYSPFPVATTMFMPEFRANNYAAAGLKTIYSISSSLSIQTEAHLFQPLQTITQGTGQQSAYETYSFGPKLMANMAFVYHTPPGPLSISMSYFNKEQEPWVFMVNFGFLLFNNQIFM